MHRSIQITTRRYLSTLRQQLKSSAMDSDSFPQYDYPLEFEVLKECSVSKARCRSTTLWIENRCNRFLLKQWLLSFLVFICVLLAGSRLKLPHATLETPQFMPVGTQGALKGVLPDQIKELNCNLILGNTYHLGHRPVGIRFQRVCLVFLLTISFDLNYSYSHSIKGPELLKKAGGLHKFMNWDGALLTVIQRLFWF